MKSKYKNHPIWDEDGYEEAPGDINCAIEASFESGIRLELKDLVPKTKERVNIMLDKDVVQFFKEQAKKHGGKYQTMINGVLSAYVKQV